MTGPIVGVARAEIDFDAEDSEIVSTGNLWAEPPAGELIVGKVILYTLDQGRLVEMFDAARAGATNDDILLALDAAALGAPEDDDA